MTVEHLADAAGSSIQPGFGDVLGATVTPDGVNFAVYARRATGLDLLLFETVDDPAAAARRIALDPRPHRTGDYWHAFVPGLGAGQLYGFAAHGPWDPADGLRFDPTRVLLDPYGRGTAFPDGYRRQAASDPPQASVPMKSVVIDPETMTGKATGHSTSPSARRSSTRPTWRDSPPTRIPGSRPSAAGRTPGSSRRSRTSSSWA